MQKSSQVELCLLIADLHEPSCVYDIAQFFHPHGKHLRDSMKLLILLLGLSAILLHLLAFEKALFTQENMSGHTAIFGVMCVDWLLTAASTASWPPLALLSQSLFIPYK